MTRGTSSARRYAEAGFEIALRDDAVAGWQAAFVGAVQALRDERVARVAHSPTVSPAARRDLIASAVGRPFPRPFANLLLVLLQRRRIQLLPQVAAEFQRLVDRRAGITRAVVTSAVPLEQADLRAVRTRLEEMTGDRVELTTLVDDGLIGGLRVRIGDRLIDGSVRGRLERLRGQLIAGVL